MAPVYNSHFLVHWTDDRKFSIVKRSQIVDKKLRELPDYKLWNVTTLITWKKTEQYEATIKDSGNF
jgi:hypothetical protein